MRIGTLFMVFAACAAAYGAQEYQISGVVTDTAENGIADVVIRLEQGRRTTTSDADGRFLLTTRSAVAPTTAHAAAVLEHAAAMHAGRLYVRLREGALVELASYELTGRLVARVRRVLDAGSHSFVVPAGNTGVRIHSVKIGGVEHRFREGAGRGGFGEQLARSDGSPMGAAAKQSAMAAAIEEVIVASKEGWLTYRAEMRNSDTSGVEIVLIPNAGLLRDIDGNTYETVRLGDQVWMAENLRVTHYNDSTPITHVPERTQWVTDSAGAYCFYDNSTDTLEQKKWGALYNWYAVNTGKLAPEGWRVPSEADWVVLKTYLAANGYNYDSTITPSDDTTTSAVRKVGKSLASKTDWDDWATEDVPGAVGNELSTNNRTGFSALPSGFRWYSGDAFFGYQGHITRWWTTDELDSADAVRCCLEWSSPYLLVETTGYAADKEYGYSVRLVRDVE